MGVSGKSYNHHEQADYVERLEHARMWRLILVQPFQYSLALLWSLMEQQQQGQRYCNQATSRKTE